jgi:polyhydroxyalkanoate synthesis regulator phasin
MKKLIKNIKLLPKLEIIEKELNKHSLAIHALERRVEALSRELVLLENKHKDK